MSLALIIELILLIVALAGIFANYVNGQYVVVGRFIAAVCVLLLFLIAVGAVRL